MEARLGRVATPAIVMGERVFWGFDDNKRDIADLLGIGVGSDRPPSEQSSDSGEAP